MNKKIVLLVLILAIVLLVSGVFLANSVITGQVVLLSDGDREFDYVWTTALCEDNKCRDYEVKCKNGSVLDIKPVTGFVVFGEDWQDLRQNEGLCSRR